MIDRNYDNVKNILIIKYGALGDVIQAMPAFNSIYHFFKDLHKDDFTITLMTRDDYVDFLSPSPWFHHVIGIKKTSRNHPKILMESRAIAKKSYDMVIDLQMSNRSNQLGFLVKKLFASKKATLWAGASPHGDIILKNDPAVIMNEKKRLSLLFEKMGLPKPYMAENNTKWMLLSSIALPALTMDRMVLLFIGAGAKRSKKRWPIAHYIALAQLLLVNRFQPILMGADMESHHADQMMAQLPQLINMVGKSTIAQTAYLVNMAKAVIGNDTGPMHLASLLEKPNVVLFGPASDAQRHASSGQFTRAIQVKTLATLDHYIVFDIMMDVYSHYERLHAKGDAIDSFEIFDAVKPLIYEESLIPFMGAKAS